MGIFLETLKLLNLPNAWKIHGIKKLSSPTYPMLIILIATEAKVAIPIMIVNGTADPLNPYKGGMMQSGTFIMGNVRSTDHTFQYWASLGGYRGEPTKELVADKDPADRKTIERYTYKEKGKPEIVILKVIGGKHDYPNDIDVHVEAWEFFKRQL